MQILAIINQIDSIRKKYKADCAALEKGLAVTQGPVLATWSAYYMIWESQISNEIDRQINLLQDFYNRLSNHESADRDLSTTESAALREIVMREENDAFAELRAEFKGIKASPVTAAGNIYSFLHQKTAQPQVVGIPYNVEENFRP